MKSPTQKLKKEYDGCPCGMKGDCCENPVVTGGEHECTDSCESICEENYELVCQNCGTSCYHEL